MADVGEMNPDLMRPPGLELERHERGDRLAILTVESLPHFIMGHRLASTLPHCHLLAGMRVAVERRIDAAARPVGHTPGKGEIAALHRAGAAVIGELRRQ